jgi:hypothetical protein
MRASRYLTNLLIRSDPRLGAVAVWPFGRPQFGYETTLTARGGHCVGATSWRGYYEAVPSGVSRVTVAN